MKVEKNEYLVEMKHISKIFPGVKALDDINFNLKPGEVHVLMGENGAGKSTLMKILAGAYTPDEGELYIEGEKVTQFDPISMKNRGIGIIYQELNMVPYLNVAENIFIDQMPQKGFFLNKKAMHANAQKILADMKMKVDTHALAGEIPVAQQQMVEVAKALTHDLKVLIMDEPTAALSGVEIEQLFTIVRSLKEKGIGIIYISHRMQEIPMIGDRITILRDGQYIATHDVKEITSDEIVRLMVGRKLGNLYPKEPHTRGEVVLKVEHLNSKKERLTDICMEVCKGEIVGLAGLVGAGRTELARAIFHVDPYESGRIWMKGEEIKRKATPHQMIEKGLSLIPEDRKRQGLSLILPVSQNIVMAHMDKISPRGWIQKKKEKEIVDQYIKELNISTPSSEQIVNNLSGGNQQKVVLAKWLCTQADIIIFDEPTRGIDIGAKKEVYTFMEQLAKEGKAIIMISSEMPEIIGMSDRIYVMKNRRIVKELDAEHVTQEEILSYALEGARTEAEHE
ncbi:MAG: sugar ABC transporter ATP-binding protein [Candidatus Choladocola sp.]|nr:sugar ABC transporter ATP-binding protein [Candidatus Choladocola sp.]